MIVEMRGLPSIPNRDTHPIRISFFDPFGNEPDARVEQP